MESLFLLENYTIAWITHQSPLLHERIVKNLRCHSGAICVSQRKLYLFSSQEVAPLREVFNFNRPPQLSVYTGPPISFGDLFQLGLYSEELNFQNWATMQLSEKTPQTELPNHLEKTENFGFL